jgi:hypothetical protein
MKWAELLPVKWTCDRCHKVELQLLVLIDGSYLCPRCWRAAGEPARYNEAAEVERARQEIETRARMLQRGGEDRYRVLAGKA